MEHDRRISSKLAGALIGAVAALSIGGVGLAFAQGAETPTTEAPAAETPATPAAPEAPARPDGEDCPHHQDGARGGGAPGSDADAPPAANTGAEV